jgi:AraC-like DNA-binding protein
MILVLMSIVLTLRILLYALNQPVFLAITPPETTLKIPREDLDKMKARINTLLTEQKIFCDPKLTLKDLAHHLDASERTVSFVINNSMAGNFYDLINNYRIEEVQKIFQTTKDKKLTILEVLYQVGFNSKSSFNTQFKKKTGLSPSEFRRQLNKI